MNCYICAGQGKETPAVAICIVCGMALCRITSFARLPCGRMPQWAWASPVGVPETMPRIVCEACHTPTIRPRDRFGAFATHAEASQTFLPPGEFATQLRQQAFRHEGGIGDAISGRGSALTAPSWSGTAATAEEALGEGVLSASRRAVSHAAVPGRRAPA